MDVKLPKLGEGADSGVVVTLFVKEGDPIKKDQAILELENEKAVASIPSSADGVVSKVHVKEGDKVTVGARLISVTEAGGSAPAPAAAPAAGEAKPKATGGKPAATPAPEPEVEEESPEAKGEAEPAEGNGSPEPAASPSLRRLAREVGIDLRKVRGSGRGGRIESADVRAYIQRLIKLAAQPKSAAPAPGAPAKAPAESVDFSKWGPVTKKSMTSLRKVISRRMTENWTTIPHVTQFDEADITGVLELRKQHLAAYEAKGGRLTLTPFALKAIAVALKKHPIFNSSLDEAAEEIVLKDYIHIGVAVDSEHGLMVPVIRDVDKKSLLDLSKEVEELAKKVRDRKISPDELKGGTFTISNQGGIGGAHFTPIINKPEAAILGLGRGAVKAVVKDKQIVQRTMLPIAISYDHRLIDGGTAARFTVDLIAALEGFSEADVKLA